MSIPNTAMEAAGISKLPMRLCIYHTDYQFRTLLEINPGIANTAKELEPVHAAGLLHRESSLLDDDSGDQDGGCPDRGQA